jgi:hypothetical protein
MEQSLRLESLISRQDLRLHYIRCVDIRHDAKQNLFQHRVQSHPTILPSQRVASDNFFKIPSIFPNSR